MSTKLFFGINPSIFSKREESELSLDIINKLKDLNYYVETNKQKHKWKTNDDNEIKSLLINIFNKITTDIKKIYNDKDLYNAILEIKITDDNIEIATKYILDKVSSDYRVNKNAIDYIKVYAELIILFYKSNFNIFFNILTKRYVEYINKFINNTLIQDNLIDKSEIDDITVKHELSFKGLSILIAELYIRNKIPFEIMNKLLSYNIKEYNKIKHIKVIIQIIKNNK